MNTDRTLAALVDEASALDAGSDDARRFELWTAAAALVDRSAQPKKWAALRHMAATAAFRMPGRLDDALAAFRDARPHWDPVADHGQWAETTSYIGWSLFALGRLSPPDSEEAIACLEATIADYPDDTPGMLARLYAFRAVGDPLDNWTRRVRYLEMALAQVAPAADPVPRALLLNDLALAWAQEPDGHFAARIEQRIGLHGEALALLAAAKEEPGSPARYAWIRIAVDASEAFLHRLAGGDAASNHAEAERLARAGLAACDDATPRDVAAIAVMALARVLMSTPGRPSGARFSEAIELCDRAEALVDPEAMPATAATAHQFRASAELELMRLGEPGRIGSLLFHVDAALALLAAGRADPPRLTLQLIAADGLLEVDDFAGAAARLAAAEHAGERALAQASQRAGRLERIFDLHDCSSLLGHCLLRLGDVAGAVEAIDRNKARLWSAGRAPASFAEIRRAVPAGGALLFPVFAPRAGAVVVVAEGGERVCALPGLDRDRLAALLYGDLLDPASDSWVARYVRRHDDPPGWADRIDSMGAVLHDLVWTPLLEALRALGVAEGAELVWVGQAGTNVLPLHAAWTIDVDADADADAGRDADAGAPTDAGGAPSVVPGRRWITDRHPVRYAVSARCLVENLASRRGPAPPRTLMVCNPASDLADLPYAAFESAWLRQAAPAGPIDVLGAGSATVEAVLGALPSATLAHFASHGVFEVADPMRSSLVLAGGRPLTLEAMLPAVAASRLDTVVLSACETAVAPSWRKADEMIGFPAAFLEHGVSTVIASLWPVDDFATAALLGRFYREWRSPPGRTAAAAMQAAQRWLRDATAAELSVLLLELEAEGGDVAALAAGARQSLADAGGDARLFAHPQFWAAFTVTGA